MKLNSSQNLYGVNFAYPKTFGFCSGWNNNFNPDGEYRLTRRVAVNLINVPATNILDDKEDFVYLKSNENKVDSKLGLSSGAGSSLYERNSNSSYKIKRNGYKNGFAQNSKYTSTSLDIANFVENTTQFDYRGILTKENAQNEFFMLQELSKEGFCNSHETSKLLKYVIPNTQIEAYAIESVINSDLRLDEFIFALYSNHLAREVEKGTLKCDEKNGTFSAVNYDINSFLENQQLLKDLELVGKTLGYNYSNFHKANFIRSYPHSWFGNEVLCNDGSISFVDLEYASQNKKPDSNFKLLQHLEKTQAQCALFSEFETMGLHLFAIGAMYLSNGFKEGYNRKFSFSLEKIPSRLIDKAFESYTQNKIEIWRKND